MIDKDTIEKILNEKELNFRVWGRKGKDLIGEIQKDVSFQLNDEIKYFIENIGNLDIGHYSILVTGDENKSTTSITESEVNGLFEEECPLKGIQILDIAGLSYILLDNGEINAYEYHDIFPGEEIFTFESFEALINEIINRVEEDKKESLI